MEKQLRRNLLAIFLCVLAVAVACGQGDTSNPTLTPRPSAPALPDPTPAPRAASVPTVPPTLLVPTPTPEIHSSTDPVYSVSPSLEEQVFFSDAIVRASLLSASAGTESVPSDPGVAPTYRAVHELRFTVHEYLKGSGPSEVLVVVRDEDTFVAETDALSWAQEQLTERETTWDDREGVLFLRTAEPYQSGGASGGSQRSTAQSSPVPALEFTLSNYVVQTPWDYSIDTLSRAWMPSGDAGSSAPRSSESSSTARQAQVYITDGSQSPPPVVSLLDLRSKITELETTLASGAGIEGFWECIGTKILRERTYRAGPPWTPAQFEATLVSGSAAGTEVHRKYNPYRETQYHRFWLSGQAGGLFQTLIDDADSVPDNGYDHALALARPLPAGEYRVNYNKQHYVYFPCNFVPDSYSEWTVTVTAPAGTLHEAFFDPVAVGAAVGADGSNGVLEPAAFTVGGASATITSLKWEAGAVTMTLNPTASLAGHAIDFIALDGSVTTTLSFDDATQGGGGALTWSVASQPWNAGDLLMLRIRSTNVIITPPTATPTPTPTAAPTATPTPTPTPAATPTPTPTPMATPTPTPTPTPTSTPTPTTTEPITVTLTPRVEGSETYVNLTIEWNDHQPCDGQYMVALYSTSDYLVTFMGFHPAPATTSLSSETYMWWDSRFFPDRWAGVSCDPSDWSGRRELGRVSLRAVHPDNN